MKNILAFSLLLFLFSCKKQDDWLDVKSNMSDIVPTTLQDFQAVLDRDDRMVLNRPGLDLVSADNYSVSDANYLASQIMERNAHIWAADIYQSSTAQVIDWLTPYYAIVYANIALEGLQKIEKTEQNKLQWENIYGSALFYRAYAFYSLSQLFSKPYSSATANSDLGIPLRLSSDVNIIYQRATLQETYDRIINDLKEAERILTTVPVFKTRPSKQAAMALLAKVYLSMDDYAKANEYVNAALAIQSNLIEFQSLPVTTGTANPFPTIKNGNVEIVFYAEKVRYSMMREDRLLVDTSLYNQYGANDLRKTVFYSVNANGIVSFKGNITGGTYFAGISTGELYLIRAETYARLGNTNLALKNLNDLLKTRWKKNGSTSTYIDQTASNANEALNKIITERRKELPFTTRWEDLRRLNKEPAFAVTLERVVGGSTYTLLPNDQRYVLPIPELEIRLSGILQNPR